ncbi:MAG: response regulator transcription factor [Pseudomonadota bacterium]
MTPSEKILIIDDDLALQGLLLEFFNRNNLSCIQAKDSDSAMLKISEHHPDLIILDVMLPGGMDGFAVCERIKKRFKTPVIMLSARGEVHDRIRGLELGADDYMPKPFNPSELLVRARKILARASVTTIPVQVMEFDNLTIDTANRKVTVDDAFVALSGSEFEVLNLLASRPGEIIHRDQISRAIAGHDWNAFSRSVDAIVSRLRARIGDPARSPRFLTTVWGRGYVFIGKKRRDEP